MDEKLEMIINDLRKQCQEIETFIDIKEEKYLEILSEDFGRKDHEDSEIAISELERAMENIQIAIRSLQHECVCK